MTRDDRPDGPESAGNGSQSVIGAVPERRLPPGQQRAEGWPVLDLGAQPEISTAAWRLSVEGLVEQPVVWDWAELLAQPQMSIVADVHCGTGWSVCGSRWDGIAARHLLSVVRPRPQAAHVICHGTDGYDTNLRLTAFGADDVLLAIRRNGVPIPREHGGPVRVIVPQLLFWKSTKWIERLEFTATDRPGYWERLGYDNEGDPWRPRDLE